MSYIDSNLVPGEKVFYRAKIHWFIFVPWAILVFFVYRLWNAAPLLLVFPLAKYVSTEMAVTSRRVVLKTGLFSLKTVEMNLSKVESLSIDQGVIGRSWDTGPFASSAVVERQDRFTA